MAHNASVAQIMLSNTPILDVYGQLNRSDLENPPKKRVIEKAEDTPIPETPSPSLEDETQPQPNPDVHELMFEDMDNVPLYANSKVTLLELFIMLCYLMKEGNLTDKIMDLILTLLQLVLPQPNNAFKSLYFFNKILDRQKLPSTMHYYCKQCTRDV